MTFHVGDTVMVKHQRELGVFKVDVDFDPIDTPIPLTSGYTVTGYVRISNDNNKLLGYHPENLEVV